MNCKLTNVLMFAAGAAVGSAVTWKILDTRLKAKYERIVQEELESIRETFSDDQPDDDEEDETDSEYKQIKWEDFEDLDEEDDDDEVSKQTEMKRYTKLANAYTSEKGGAEDMTTEKPYVIGPHEFGELDGYSQVELTYYADGVLEDEDYNIVTDVDELIGSDSLYTFGEYEEDAVFVRNERLRADFQILKDYQTYEEARSTGPNRVDHE